MISGYRPYSLLIDSIRQIIDLKDSQKIDVEKYKAYWPTTTERELREIQQRAHPNGKGPYRI